MLPGGVVILALCGLFGLGELREEHLPGGPQQETSSAGKHFGVPSYLKVSPKMDQASTKMDQTSDEMDQASYEMDWASDEMDQALDEMDQASTEREPASADRAQASAKRRMTLAFGDQVLPKQKEEEQEQEDQEEEEKEEQEDQESMVRRFKQLGFPGDGVPPDLSAFSPRLLHEASVVQYMDTSQDFRFLDEGSHASIYLGELKDSGTKVIIKHFLEGSAEDLVLEAQLLAYLEDTGLVPRLHGLLPAGLALADLALVVDLVQHTQSLQALLASHAAFSPRQYLSIAWQVAAALLTFHQRYVLFNDVHGKNVLVRWQGTEPVVFLVDFGLASFREGQALQTFTHTETPFESIAPEVKWRNQLTSPESEVFALGHLLEDINVKVNDTDLAKLVRACQHLEPLFRPPLTGVVASLQSLLHHYTAGVGRGGEEYREEGEGEEEEDVLLQEPLPLVDPRDLIPKSLEDTDLLQVFGLHEERSLWIERHRTWNISAATYHITEEDVWIITSGNGDFERTRNEASMMRYLGDTGHVLRLLGVLLKGEDIDSMSLVTESFTPCVSLKSLLEGPSPPTPSLALRLARQLAAALASVHAKRVLINNIRPTHIRVRVAEERVDVRFLRLTHTTMGRGYRHKQRKEELARFRHLAPEVRMRRATTSFASDVYSLGVILADLLTSSPEPRVKAIVDACLAAVPQDRPTASKVTSMFDALLSPFESMP